MLTAAPARTAPSAWPRRSSARQALGRPRASGARQTEHNQPWQDGTELTLTGLCSSVGCSMELLVASVHDCRPSLEQRQCLAERLTECRRAPQLQAFAASLAVQQQQQQQDGPQADTDAVWRLGACADRGDVWCLLQLAALCSRQAAAAKSSGARRRHYATALRLLHQAGAAVHAAAAEWDVWLRGGASAALGSFVALCSSGTSLQDVNALLAEVSALVTDAAAEEGGAELWALQHLLQRQEERLALECST